MSKKCKCIKTDVPFYEGCECDVSVLAAAGACDVKAMLREAMKDELRAARRYRYLAELAQCESDKEMLIGIRLDEKRHFRLLQEIYRDLTCECFPAPRVCVKRPKNICKGLKKAICAEMDDVAFYEQLAQCLTDMQHKEIVLCILNDEREHAQQLAALYRIYVECACKAGEEEEECFYCCKTTLPPCEEVEDECHRHHRHHHHHPKYCKCK